MRTQADDINCFFTRNYLSSGTKRKAIKRMPPAPANAAATNPNEVGKVLDAKNIDEIPTSILGSLNNEHQTFSTISTQIAINVSKDDS